MDGKLTQTTPAHILAACSAICKDLVEKLQVCRVETSSYEEAATASYSINIQSIICQEPACLLPLREIDILVGGKVSEPSVLDSGSQIIVIQKNLALEVGATINADQLLQLEGANGATNWTLGCAEHLPMSLGGIYFTMHAHVVECAPFHLLLGRPFQHALLCQLKDLPSGKVEVSICDPANTSHRVNIPLRPRQVQVASVRILTLSCLPLSNHASDHHTTVQAYKTVTKKVCPIPTSLPEEFRNIHCIPSNPLLSLPLLSPHSPDFIPGKHLTQERMDVLKLNWHNFLWPEELKLLQHVLLLNKPGLAWTEAEKGHFRDNYFLPIKIPVIEHIPWAHCNFAIPPGILSDVIQFFKDKFVAGIYEHSDASYRSCWFCVKKKNDALQLVYDLQPLNAVIICNSGVPLIADQLIEAMAGRSCYSMLDLFIGYDHRTLNIISCDLITVQTLIGAVWLTSLPMGWTNASAIFHEDVIFILEPEIPHVAWPFVDDCSIKGLATCFETDTGGYETLPENPGIRKFIWQHLLDVHRILHHLLCAGATVSAKKLFVAVPEVIILGHKCNYEGHVPDDSKIAHIRDWPPCKNVTDVCAFLGTAGFMRIWIKNYSALACPLVKLTHKEQAFVWTAEHDHAMNTLKKAIIQSPTLISIDYPSGHPVYLAIDSSIHGVGWILSQDCADRKRCPSHFGSISWNEHES